MKMSGSTWDPAPAVAASRSPKSDGITGRRGDMGQSEPRGSPATGLASRNSRRDLPQELFSCRWKTQNSKRWHAWRQKKKPQRLVPSTYMAGCRSLWFLHFGVLSFEILWAILSSKDGWSGCPSCVMDTRDCPSAFGSQRTVQAASGRLSLWDDALPAPSRLCCIWPIFDCIWLISGSSWLVSLHNVKSIAGRNSSM